MTDARYCGTVWVIVQRVGTGYVGELSCYTVFVEQSDRIPVARRRDIVHQGPGTIRYG